MDQLIPVGVWIRMTLPLPTSLAKAGTPFVGFTYVDPAAGLSAKGGPEGDPTLAKAPAVTVRLSLGGFSWQPLSEQEIARYRLPLSPAWIESYGAQPSPGTLGGA